MKQPNMMLKIAAIVSSVLLVGGFVAYRAGAFDWVTGSDSSTGDAAEQGRMMPSSKIGRIFDQGSGTEQPTPITQVQTLMPGSKSFAISPLIPPPKSNPGGAAQQSVPPAPAQAP